MKKLFSALLITVYILSFSQESKPPFWQDIQEFKKTDLINPPTENSVLLLGSSTFTKWTDVNDYFLGKNIINRGFGGSRLIDLNYYAEDLLSPYIPKQIIVYCGENDFADNKELSPKILVGRFKVFYQKMRKKFPTIEIDYISMKYSPSRENLWPKMRKSNNKIARFMKKETNAEFIDITKIMNDKNGRIRSDLFTEDHLHMTAEGYRLWSIVMTPYMK